MNKQLPLIINLYESIECSGVLSKYLVKQSILDIVDEMIEKHEDLYKMINAIPNVSVVGNFNTATDICNAQRKNVARASNITSGNDTCPEVGPYGKVLPPHRMFTTCEDGHVLESSIYHPCAVPIQREQETQSTFRTGGYSGDVVHSEDVATSMNGCNAGKCHNCDCCDNIDYTALFKDKEKLYHELFLWAKGLQTVQISDLISALIQAKKIPVDLRLATTLRCVLTGILNEPSLCDMTGKIGVLQYIHNTISAPHTQKFLQVFVQINALDDTKQVYLDKILKYLVSTDVKDCAVIVMTKKEYDIIQQQYPINVCFDCSPSADVGNSYISYMDMVLVEENMFLPKISMTFNTSPMVDVMAPASCLHATAGSTGKVAFLVGTHDHRKWTVDTVSVNDHTYCVEELIHARDTQLTAGVPDYIVQEYEYVSLGAELNTSNLDAELILFYKNISSDIVCNIKPLLVLSESEFNIKQEDVNYHIGDILPVDLKYFKVSPLSIQGNDSGTGENSGNDNTNTDTNGTENDPPSQNPKKDYSLVLNLPFSGTSKVTFRTRTKYRMNLQIIIRDLETKEITAKIDAPYHRAQMVSDFQVSHAVAADNNAFTMTNVLQISDTMSQKQTEYELTIPQGEFIVKRQSAPEMIQNTPYRCTNPDISLRFAVNCETKEIEFLSGDEIPSYLKEEKEPYTVNVIQMPGKTSFIAGDTVSKETFINSGLKLSVSGGDFEVPREVQENEIAISETVVTEDMTFIRLHIIGYPVSALAYDLPIDVYNQNDELAMFARCVANYSFDDTENPLRNKYTNKNAEVVQSISTDDNLPKLSNTTAIVREGPLSYMSLRSNTGEGICLDTTISSKDYTISLFVRPHSLNLCDSPRTPIFCALRPDGSYMIFYALHDNSGDFCVSIRYSEGDEREFYCRNILSEQNWNMITLSVSDKLTTICINNVKCMEISSSADSSWFSNFFENQQSTLYLGTCPSGYTFRGDYCGILLHETALTNAQIDIIYNVNF